jgi:hypothetical protein
LRASWAVVKFIQGRLWFQIPNTSFECLHANPEALRESCNAMKRNEQRHPRGPTLWFSEGNLGNRAVLRKLRI